jgi:hypothetical protein
MSEKLIVLYPNSEVQIKEAKRREKKYWVALLVVYCLGVTTGAVLEYRLNPEAVTCDYRPAGAHYEYTIPAGLVIPWGELEYEWGSELVYREEICDKDARCLKMYPMSEGLFMTLQMVAYEEKQIVSRRLVQ